MRKAFAAGISFVALLVPTWASAQTLATGAPKDTFDVATHVSGLTQPTDFRFLPDGRIVIIQKGGQVRVRRTDGTIANAGTFPVDTESEKGGLGVEVHPNFATNKTLFFYYSLASGSGGTDLDRHRVVSIALKDDNTLDMTTEKVLVKDIRGPANHDGGALNVLGDKLFIGTGDTGCNSGKPPGAANASNYFGTCLTNGNGKVLRVNLDGTIPTDNPLSSLTAVVACGASCGTVPVATTTGAPRKDIYAWGFRNAFRLWGDPVTGNVWVGDVGEVTWEDITVVKKGQHHGWPWREGAEGDPIAKCQDFTPDKSNCVDPTYACKHPECSAITGGQIVDSCDWPTTFRGLYFFADYGAGQIWTLQPNAARDGVVAGSRKNFATANGIVAIHTGNDRALYALSLNGALYRFSVKAPVTCTTPDAGPADTGPADTGVPPTDGGVTDTGTTPSDGSVSDTGSAADGGTTDDSGVAPGTDDSGGCGCQTPGTSDTSRHAGLALLGVGALIARRRRSKAR
ncbi:MAG: PQQ-dependent sugar dehydrogenase [Myxococcales bacterium]|nr:PQQ-dependent sugar dehydrogenase [Myxococcales bacterium]